MLSPVLWTQGVPSDSSQLAAAAPWPCICGARFYGELLERSLLACCDFHCCNHILDRSLVAKRLFEKSIRRFSIRGNDIEAPDNEALPSKILGRLVSSFESSLGPGFRKGIRQHCQE